MRSSETEEVRSPPDISASGRVKPIIRFDILTLFPDLLRSWLEFSIVKRAQDRGLVQVDLTDIRSFSRDRYRTVDEPPYGGGVGMLLKAEPMAAALQHCLRDRDESATVRTLLMTPTGQRLNQGMLAELSGESRIVLICGRYEGVDERFRRLYVTDEVSLGDFVLTGGELAAAAIVDGVTRLAPGVLGKDESSVDESFTSGLLEYPQYTRPAEFGGLTVPSVLLGGNHEEIRQWRERQSLLSTAANRPDLLPEDWRDRLNPPRRKRKR